jgi:outer membrane cobalamin receptor
VQLAWAAARASVDLTGSLVGRRADSDYSALEPPLLWNPGYQHWDLRASARATGPLWITAAVDNLVDRRYMEPLGDPALGRTVRVGVSYRR